MELGAGKAPGAIAPNQSLEHALASERAGTSCHREEQQCCSRRLA